ncbi:hypothetical protein [Helicobacter monodelphidis]|uniref:hypothetical protein n=1 Tax=Helicobacter sp. 15-1451 TaxID=2004995 RepID=UPI0015EBCC8C|nr:hypothetical protein [Helicobacter sp. 15-1451]
MWNLKIKESINQKYSNQDSPNQNFHQHNKQIKVIEFIYYESLRSKWAKIISIIVLHLASIGFILASFLLT